MNKFKLIWKILFNDKRYALMLFDRENLPHIGDIITIGDVTLVAQPRAKRIKKIGKK